MQSFSKTIKVYYVAWLSTEEYISIFYISNPTFVMEMAKLRPRNSREFWWTVFLHGRWKDLQQDVIICVDFDRSYV